MLGAVVANRWEGDPVWLAVIAPPGAGKTEVIAALAGLEDVYPTGTLTEAGLLSGTPRKDSKGKGGLLREIDEFGIIVCKDFGSVLSMNRDTRAAVLGALREVFDGDWTRRLGVDGGRTLHWSGKVGFIAGCTAVIDSHHAVMSAMGDRLALTGRAPGRVHRPRARRRPTRPGRVPAHADAGVQRCRGRTVVRGRRATGRAGGLERSFALLEP